MGLLVTNSPDLTLLSVQATFDISGVNPVVQLVNQSQGPNLAGVSYAFIVKSPTTTIIHDGDINDPDEVGVWSEHLISDSWPMPFNNIEWSGAPYSFQVIAKDSVGNVYEAPVQIASICRPNGNKKDSTNRWGLGSIVVQTNCDQARIYFQDATNTSYKGITGTVGSSVLRVNFPMDNTGTVPAPFQINYFSTALVPITYSGKGYQYLYTSIYDYDLGDDVHVKIKYLKSDTFGVFCNVNLMPLLCEYQKLIDSIEAGTCRDVEDAQRKLLLINPKFSLVVMGILQPLTGVDVPALIDQIIAIGGFDCDCCNAGSGVVPPGSSAFDGYTFSVVPLGGDIEGEVVANGFNIQIQLSDVSYVFKMCDESPNSNAFIVQPSTTGDGYQKTYCLLVDIALLSQEILTEISTNANLINMFTSIVNAGGGSGTGGSFELIVDGGCIFQSSATCDYVFTLPNIPTSVTFALLTSIKVGSVNIPLSYSFNFSNLPALQTYLNSLGLGTFVVTPSFFNNIFIASNTNGNDIQSITYKVSGTTYLASMTKECTGYVPLSANQVVQYIINHLCALSDSDVETSQSYEVCYINSSGVKVTETVPYGTDLASFFATLTERGCTTIDYILTIGRVNCSTIKTQFPQLTTQAMQATDGFLGTKNGQCATIPTVEAFLTMLTYGAYNADVVNAFCGMLSICSVGQPCEAYNVFQAEVQSGSPTSDLVITFDHPSAVSNTIRYARIDNTVSPVYTTVTGVLPGDSPLTISVDNGQYRVYIRPIYSDGRTCPEIYVDTAPCTGVSSFSATYDGTNINVAYTADPSVDYVRLTLNYPNGGTATSIYANGDPIVITPPSGVYGTFFASLQAVCNLSTQFYSAPTGQSTFNIPNPYTVIIQTTNPLGGGSHRITNITNLSGFTLGSNVNEGQSQGGFHSTFTNTIEVELVNQLGTSNNVSLYVNDSFVECSPVTVESLFPQTHTFSSATYASTDVIKIVYDQGDCSP